jgi:hypothetical protein
MTIRGEEDSLAVHIGIEVYKALGDYNKPHFFYCSFHRVLLHLSFEFNLCTNSG